MNAQGQADEEQKIEHPHNEKIFWMIDFNKTHKNSRK